MELEHPEPTPETVSDAFGFEVPPAMVGLARAAAKVRPDEPHKAFEPLGLCLGGPLYPFVGGHGVSLRILETPPEMFPFARCGRTESHFGLVVDDPGEKGGLERTVASLEPESSQGCRVLAPSLGAFLSAAADRALKSPPAGADPKAHRKEVERLVKALKKEVDLEWPADAERIALEGLAGRERSISYRTQDALGVVVPEEPSPLELISVDSRRMLIETRDRSRVHEAARRALRVGAPGAGLALARDLIWMLGYRAEWYRIAVDIMEEVYPTLNRPLLARVSRREWARHYRQSRG